MKRSAIASLLSLGLPGRFSRRSLTASLALALSLGLLGRSLAMNNPGVVPLGDFQIATAGQQATPAAQVPVNLQGMTALSCQARFLYGSGGTQVNVFIQTSLDQGATWIDLANIQFTTSSGTEEINLSGLAAVTTPTAPGYLTLAANTTFNGPLGDRLQAQVVSQGTYGSGTLVSVRCVAR